MLKSRMFNALSAMLFFVVAGAMIVAAAWVYDQGDVPPTTSAPAPATIPSPRTTATPPAPASRTQPATENKSLSRQAPKAQDTSLGKTVSSWLNKTFGLHLLKEETKSMLSLLCAVIGTFFSFRTYLVNRRRTLLLEQSLKNRSS